MPKPGYASWAKKLCITSLGCLCDVSNRNIMMIRVIVQCAKHNKNEWWRHYVWNSGSNKTSYKIVIHIMIWTLKSSKSMIWILESWKHMSWSEKKDNVKEQFATDFEKSCNIYGTMSLQVEDSVHHDLSSEVAGKLFSFERTRYKSGSEYWRET